MPNISEKRHSGSILRNRDVLGKGNLADTAIGLNGDEEDDKKDEKDPASL